MDQSAFEFAVWSIVAGLCAPCVVAIVAMIGYLRMLPELHRSQMRMLECSAPPPYLQAFSREQFARENVGIEEE